MDYLQMADLALADYQAKKLREYSLEGTLKGTAVCLALDSTGERLWIVADEEDARRLGEPRGETFTAEEVRIIARIDDPHIVEDIRQFKKLAKAEMKDPKKWDTAWAAKRTNG